MRSVDRIPRGIQMPDHPDDESGRLPGRVFLRLLLFVTGFSGVFFWLRTSETYLNQLLAADLQDLGGIPWLYSIVGLIFSILAAFIIQTEWEHWTQLVGAMKDEVSALDQLRLWSYHCPVPVRKKLRDGIEAYLALTIQNGWSSQDNDRSDAFDTVMTSLRNAIVDESRPSDFILTASSILRDLSRHQRDRLNYAARRMPVILRQTFMFACSLVILLSLFIGVRNMWLDYLFTVSIALLAFLLYLVVDDLDNPLRPGIWHVTLSDYRRLLLWFQSRIS